MVFEFEDVVRLKRGRYRGAIAKVIGRKESCSEDAKSYMVEILKGPFYYSAMGIWVEVDSSHMELLKSEQCQVK